MKWFHYTSKENYNNILSNGFKILDKDNYSVGRFGNGIYVGNNSMAKQYGDYKLTLEITCPILNLTHKEICRNIFPHLNLEEEEEGVPELKNYVLKNGYNAVSVSYEDGDTEVVIYDTSYLKIIKRG